MILTTDEITWVSDKLDTYEIKYQEIYDELKDHLLTAIENLRGAGDNRAVDIVFDQVLKQQFPGYWPFEEIVKQYQSAYGRKVSKALWLNFRSYLNWQTIPLILLLMIIAYYMPHNKTVTTVMMITLLFTSALPLGYFYINARSIKTEAGRQSLTKRKLLMTSYVLMWLFNLLFNSFRVLGEEWKAADFMQPSRYSPMVFMLLLSFFIIYGISCISVCQKELKIAEAGIGFKS